MTTTKSSPFELETVNKLYLELSQFATARTHLRNRVAAEMADLVNEAKELYSTTPKVTVSSDRMREIRQKMFNLHDKLARLFEEVK